MTLLRKSIFIFQVELEVSKELGHIFPEVIQAATLLLGGTTCAFGPANEAAYLAHLKQFVLVGRSDVLQHFRYELGANASFNGLKNTEAVGDGGFANIHHIARFNHAAGLERGTAHAHLPFLASGSSDGTRLEDACCPKPFVYSCFCVHFNS